MPIENPSPRENRIPKLIETIRALCAGRSNASGECTLSAAAASTTVAAANCGEQSEVLLTAKTANAAAEIGNGTIYVSAIGRGEFTVTHANNGQTDRRYSYVCIG